MFKPLAAVALSVALALPVSAAAAAALPRSPGAPLGYAPVKKPVVVSARGLNLSQPADAEVFAGYLCIANI